MTEIFESIMLVCFGLSWPMAVVKNIKAHTAKSMSLPFILLIITGYIAGIAAKINTGSFSYVLVIYIINLFFVSANLVVYFINLSHDHHARCHANRERVDHDDGEPLHLRGDQLDGLVRCGKPR